MKNIIACCILQLIILSSTSFHAQVGIGTREPDPSSVLDISSDSKGLLMPRLSTAERDAIVQPANGLMIYNLTVNDAQLNAGTTTAPIWIGLKQTSLDFSSGNEGLLMPRLSTTQRNAIQEPANGLMIYNLTVNDAQLNVGTPTAPNWTGLKQTSANQPNTTPAPSYMSVTEGNSISTNNETDLLMPGMTLSPPTGTYMLLFNGQVSDNGEATSTQSSTPAPSSQQRIEDVRELYNALIALPGGVSHPLLFGNGETLPSGVYDSNGATTMSGILTMDAQGDSSALFVIRSKGALSTAAGTVVNLINGANINNVFWVSEGASSTGASNTMVGTMVANNGAVTLGASTIMEGRMFSTTGAIAMGESSGLSAPTGVSGVDLGSLSSFAIFTANGAISGCPTCPVTGDVGTGLGTANGFSNINGNIYQGGGGSTVNSTNTERGISTYSIYKNGTMIPYSSRTTNSSNNFISLHSVVNVTAGDAIEVRWHVENGGTTMNQRTLSLIKANP